MRGTPVRRAILAIDIEGFGQPSRSDPDRARLRTRLHGLLDHALAAARIPPDQLAARSDLGDGILVLFDPAVSTATLLHPLLTDLTQQLAAHNPSGPVPEHLRLRLRVAVHEGHVLADQHGHTGDDLNHTFRLLEAPATRTVLTDNPAATAILVVSDMVYQGTVRHAYQGLDPSDWHPVRVHAKETRTRAWVHLAGIAGQPALPALLVAPLVGPATLPVPSELPGPIGQFTGRASELAQLSRLLDATTGAAHQPIVIAAIDGMGGIGKSALAIQAAHQLADAFPDGQLYVNLHGATSGLPPVAPASALGQLLRSLGMDPAAIPTKLEEAAARWRSLAAQRRLLVLLDNAHDAEQVRPLLPGGSSCAVLITSRYLLATLDGAHLLHLDLLPAREACELLAKLAGRHRVMAEPDAGATVVQLCGRLPLAVRIAGARLAARPTWPIRELAARLTNATHQLDELTIGALAVAAAFDVSLQALQHGPDAVDQAAAHAFGLLSLPDGPDLSTTAAARLLDQSEPTVQTLLERLVDAQLLTSTQPGRYQFHDLVRRYARRHATSHHAEAEQLAALTRLVGFYTATAWHTLRLLRPGDHRLAAADQRWSHHGLQFEEVSAALRWLEAERANLLAAIGQTAAIAPSVPAELAGELTRALLGLFVVRCYWHDGVDANHTVIQLARRTANPTAQARAQIDLGILYWRLGRYPQAIASMQDSLTRFRELGDRQGQVYSLNNLGLAYERWGRYQEALTCLQDSLALSRQLDDRWSQAYSQLFLGLVHSGLGRDQEALAYHRDSLTLLREFGDRWGQAYGLGSLGRTCGQLGRFPEAIRSLQDSLTLPRELGDRHGQAYSLTFLGVVYGRLGRSAEAIASLQDALTLLRELGDPLGSAEALRDLGDIMLRLGRHQQAREAWQEAMAIYQSRQVPRMVEIHRRLAALPSLTSVSWL